MTVDLGRYGPWAVIVGASDGVGAAFAEALAAGGLNVVLVARRQALLDDVAAATTQRHGVQTRTLAIDLTEAGAAKALIEAIGDLEVGFLVYCAGADPDFTPFLANTISAAEAMVQRNCVAPMQLCHALAPQMVQRGAGAIVILGSGAGFVGGPNMVAYGASKAFDMVLTTGRSRPSRSTPGRRPTRPPTPVHCRSTRPPPTRSTTPITRPSCSGWRFRATSTPGS